MDAGRRSAKRMSAVSAASYLTEFGIQDAPGAGLDKVAAAAKEQQSKLDDAFARGREAGRAAVQAEFDAKSAGQQALYMKRLELERHKWAISTGEDLATRLTAGLKEIENNLADAAARILRPFLEEEVHRKTIAELQASLEALISTESAVAVRGCGPADVLDALREKLGENALPGVAFEVADRADAKVITGQATIETRLKEWLASLEEAMR
jgi:flagellar biosynthesis/type III secretory pathway protein FliH